MIYVSISDNGIQRKLTLNFILIVLKKKKRNLRIYIFFNLGKQNNY